MKRGIFVLVLISFTCLYALLFEIFYNNAKLATIKNLNDIEMIEAKQAARGIQDFFTNRTHSLIALSKMDDVFNDNVDGFKDLKVFYESHQEQIISITRMNERGIITYSYPLLNLKGTDISAQNHVKQLLKDHKPLITDVFQSVQGTSTIAIHVPVFKGAEFKGSIAILIDFKSLAKHYFEGIRIGKTGYVWVISRNGTQLYSPIPGFIGKSVFENTKGYHSLDPMLHEMMKGNTGTDEFIFNKIGDKTVSDTKKYCIYMPIYIGNTYWSINVSASESDILSDLKSFKNKLLLIMVIIFIFGIVTSSYGVNAWVIVMEEEKRKKIEKELRKSESRFRNIFNNLQDAYFEINQDGTIKFVSPSALLMYGYSSVEEIVGLNVKDLYANSKERNKLIKKLERKGKADDYVCPAKRKDGSTFWVSMNIQYRYDENDQICGTVGLVRDVTERKQAEEELIKSEAKYRNIYDNAVEGMYRSSLDGKVLQANNALIKILGYDVTNDSLENMTDLAQQTWVYPYDRQKFIEIIEENNVVFGYECQFKRKDDQIIWVSLNSKLIRDEQGKGVYIEGFIQDITERKNNELEIEKKMKELQWHFDIAMQRELKMVELKKEINELLVKAGEEKRYM
jgi:two-component system, cell cycle sensor histidine kinase and response regulator CckA